MPFRDFTVFVWLPYAHEGKFLPGVQNFIVMVLTKYIFCSKPAQKAKENRKWQQETGILKACLPDEATCIKPSPLDLTQSLTAPLNLGIISSLLVFKSFSVRSGREIRVSG